MGGPVGAVHLGYLIGVKLNRQLLTVNRRALMIAKPRGSEPTRNAVLRAATMTAVALPTYLVATAAATIGLTIAGLPLGLATGIPVAWMTVPLLGGVALTIKGARRARTDVKTVTGDRTGKAIELNSLAAWPQNSVHGGRLLHAVLAKLPHTAPVVVSAGTPELHTAYRRLAERHGFQTHQDGSSGLLITPTQAQPGHQQATPHDQEALASPDETKRAARQMTGRGPWPARVDLREGVTTPRTVGPRPSPGRK